MCNHANKNKYNGIFYTRCLCVRLKRCVVRGQCSAAVCVCVGRTGGQFSATNYSSLLRQLHNFHAVALFLLFLFCLLFRCAWSRTEYRQSSWPLWSLHELEQRVALIAYTRAVFARFALPHTHRDLLFAHFRFAFGAVNSFDTAHGIHSTPPCHPLLEDARAHDQRGIALLINWRKLTWNGTFRLYISRIYMFVEFEKSA